MIHGIEGWTIRIWRKILFWNVLDEGCTESYRLMSSYSLSHWKSPCPLVVLPFLHATKTQAHYSCRITDTSVYDDIRFVAVFANESSDISIHSECVQLLQLRSNCTMTENIYIQLCVHIGPFLARINSTFAFRTAKHHNIDLERVIYNL